MQRPDVRSASRAAAVSSALRQPARVADERAAADLSLAEPDPVTTDRGAPPADSKVVVPTGDANVVVAIGNPTSVIAGPDGRFFTMLPRSADLAVRDADAVAAREPADMPAASVLPLASPNGLSGWPRVKPSLSAPATPSSQTAAAAISEPDKKASPLGSPPSKVVKASPPRALDQVLLDGRAEPSAPYRIRLFSHLAAFRTPARRPDGSPLIGTAVVAFTIDAAGKVIDAKVEDSSDAQVAQAALDLIRRASPFPPIPLDLAASQLEVHAPNPVPVDGRPLRRRGFEVLRPNNLLQWRVCHDCSAGASCR